MSQQASLVFQTTNTALATALATCGVPFATGTSGDPQPFLNIYDVKLLRDMGYKGWKLEDAARDAWERGRPGKIVYNFERNETLERVIEGFDTQAKKLANPDLETGELTLPTLNPEEFGALCCQFAKNRKALQTGWRVAMPHIAVMGAARTDRHGDREVTVGSFKVFSLNASKETRTHLGIV